MGPVIYGQIAIRKLRDFALLPLWSAEILTGAKCFERNPIIGNLWLNTRGLHASRVRLAHYLAQARRTRLSREIAGDDVQAFARDGFFVRRNFLPDEMFQTLRDAIRDHSFALRERFEGTTLLRKTRVTARLRAEIPALSALLAAPAWNALIRLAGARDAASEVHVQAIPQHAAEAAQDPQSFLHADTFHPTVKAWFYLTDVEEAAWPLLYVRGSHRLDAARLAWEHTTSLVARDADDADTREGSFRVTAQALDSMGLPPPTALAVPANTLIVADTFGFHARGIAAYPSLRVEIWASGRRNPFLPWPVLDRLVHAAGRPRVAWHRRVGGMFDPAEAGAAAPGYAAS